MVFGVTGMKTSYDIQIQQIKQIIIEFAELKQSEMGLVIFDMSGRTQHKEQDQGVSGMIN
jgi:hypothetical protein